VLRLLAIPYSTNVERVTLALGLKGLDAQIEMVDPANRARVRYVSGQDLVPVLIDGTSAIADSPAILAHLDERYPDPGLYPRDPRARAEAEIFVQWFNHVWKGPPNEIDALTREGSPDAARVEELAMWLAGSLDLFQGLLAGSPTASRFRS